MQRHPGDVKFDMHDPRLLNIWDEIQHVQTDFCFAQELSAYYMSSSWLSHARTVLDVGTGNGYFLSRLHERFPEKTYLGIDISVELLERAQSKFGNLRGVEFRVQDYFNVTDLFDFVIMRLFWQHLSLSELDAALVRLAAITAPGGSVLITDAYDEARCFVPDLPELRRVIAEYSEQQTLSGRSRQIVRTLVDRFASDEGWRIGSDLRLIMPSTLPGYRLLYGRIYELWIELFECLGQINVNYEPVKRELANWNRSDGGFTQAGLRVIRVDRRT